VKKSVAPLSTSASAQALGRQHYMLWATVERFHNGLYLKQDTLSHLPDTAFWVGAMVGWARCPLRR
jgi:hypothetical protein